MSPLLFSLFFFLFFTPPPPSFLPLFIPSSKPSSLTPSILLSPLSSSPLPTCSVDLAAVVRGSTGGHAGVSRGQAARWKPAPAGQPRHALATHQRASTERQGPKLAPAKQDQGEGERGSSLGVHDVCLTMERKFISHCVFMEIFRKSKPKINFSITFLLTGTISNYSSYIMKLHFSNVNQQHANSPFIFDPI